MSDIVLELSKSPRCRGTLTGTPGIKSDRDTRTENATSSRTAETVGSTDGARTFYRAEGSNPLCGDSIVFEVATARGADGAETVTDARWDGYACALCSASTEALARTLVGRDRRSWEQLTDAVLVQLLGVEPPRRSRANCLHLPLSVFEEAMAHEPESDRR